MNREEILAKSREEKHDEGFLEAENQGRKIGMIAFCIIFIFIIIFNLINGIKSYGPMTMFWAFLAAESYPKYRFTKNKLYLCHTIVSAIASLGFLLCYILTALE